MSQFESDGYQGAETFAVFGTGPRRTAFRALDVRRMTRCDRWDGRPVVDLAQLLQTASSSDQKTYVLEVETSEGELLPVLVSGLLSIRTVARNKIRPLSSPEAGSSLIQALVEDSGAQLLVVAPDAFQRYVERLERGEPPTRRERAGSG